MAKKYDVAVIGGGPGGYVAAIKAAQLGGTVVLFERDVVGGTCLNRGCIPTKTYIKTAQYVESIKNSEKRGIFVDTSTLSVDMQKVVAYKDDVVKKLTGGVAGLLKSNGVDVVAESAKLASPTTIEANGEIYEATAIILAGGSKAGRLPIVGIDHPMVVTSDGILKVTTVPKTLAVMGGGVIGCEIATAFAAFGSKVTIVELAENLVPTMDCDVSKEIKKSLQKMGVCVMTGAKVKTIEDNNNKPVLCLEDGKKVEAELVLLSIGRQADLGCLGNQADKITVSRGRVEVDDFMCTALPSVYAVGDINGRCMLAHAAFKMGEVAAINAMGAREKANLSHVPCCLYTMPEAASVGLTEMQAKERGEIVVGRFPFGANGRALASGEPDGFVKVIADKKYGEILGVHIVGDVATEMIIEGSVMMDMEITIHEAAEIIHPHPTYSEAFMEACGDALGRCLHLPKKK